MTHPEAEQSGSDGSGAGLDTGGRAVVVCAHRGPVSFSRAQDGSLEVRRGAGGLVTALLGLLPHLRDAVWVAHASGEADAEVARGAGGEVRVAFSSDDGAEAVDDDAADDRPSLRVRPVVVDDDDHNLFYGTVSNPLLWFTQHSLYGMGSDPSVGPAEHAAWAAYERVNDVFAEETVAAARGAGGESGRVLVLLQDYHLYLVAPRVREECPDAVISHFTHIPWPGPDGWRALPPAWVRAVVGGLLACDVVAFHTPEFAASFLLTVRALTEHEVDLDASTVAVDGRTVAVRSYPISIDVESVREVARGPRGEDYRADLTARILDAGQRLMVRVDRTDPSKNIVRGFLAFGQMLDEHPELVGEVVFLAVLQPSRQNVAEYADYLGSIGAVVAEINARHRRDGYEPVDLRMQDDLPLALAALRIADVVMVNSVNDGMNLVAKEASVLSERDAVLVLSTSTGAVGELGGDSLVVSPVDVSAQAAALAEAFTRDPATRERQATARRELVEARDVTAWMTDQLADLVPSGS